MGDSPSSAAFSNDSKRSANEFITVASRALKGRYVLESVGSLSVAVTSPVEEYRRTLHTCAVLGAPHCTRVSRHAGKLAETQAFTHLCPGNAPKTASVFSSLHAMCAFRNASSCDKNVCREIPGGLLDCAQRAHCVGERSMITLRCEGLSILHQCFAWGILPRM